MIITTTPTVEGRQITEYLGIVSGEAVGGTNFIKDFFAGITDIIGGRSRGYEKSLSKIRDQSLEDMSQQAEALGADAIVGIDLDYEVIASDSRNMMLCIANGTAVKLG